MAKIIKNQKSPAADISLGDVGVTIPASGQYTLNNAEILLWSDAIILSPASQLVTLINSGDIVVNNGTSDFNAADGIGFLKYPDRATIQLGTTDTVRVAEIFNFEGDVNVVKSAAGKATITIGETGTATGKLYVVTGFSTGVTIDKWLNVEHPNATSDETPFTMPGDGKTIALTYSNANNLSTLDVEFYVNNVLQFTWSIRDKRNAFKILNTGLFNVSQGDRVSIFIKDFTSGTNQQDFVDADVTVSTDTVNVLAHGYLLGQVVELETTGTLPSGLLIGTEYYIINVDTNNIKFAATLEDAIAGTPVDITAATGGGTHTIESGPSVKSKDPTVNISLIITNLPDGDGGQELGD